MLPSPPFSLLQHHLLWGVCQFLDDSIPFLPQLLHKALIKLPKTKSCTQGTWLFVFFIAFFSWQFREVWLLCFAFILIFFLICSFLSNSCRILLMPCLISVRISATPRSRGKRAKLTKSTSWSKQKKSNKISNKKNKNKIKLKRKFFGKKGKQQWLKLPYYYVWLE